jgi:hydrogenase expression/formation protein HypC
VCLAVPGKIISIKDDLAVIDYNQGVMKEANCSLIECKVGDYVIIQAGFIVEIVDENRAKSMIDLIE